MISAPKRLLTVAFMPRDISLSLNLFTFLEVERLVSLTSFKGIRFTCGVERMYFLSTLASAIAPASVSFLSAISVY